MPTTRKSDLPWTTITVDTTGETFIPADDFREMGGATTARGWCEVRSRIGSILLSPAVQCTNDPRNPGSGTQIKVAGGDANGYAAANGNFDPDQTATTLPSGFRWIRSGWVAKVTSGVGHARVRGCVELRY